MKELLSRLSSALLKFHRGLLLYQADLAEKSDGKKYSPYELLNLSLNDARFSWLRRFSELIIQIDTIVDDKKNTPFDAADITTAIRKIIHVDSEGSSPELIAAIRYDASIMIPLGDVRRALVAVENAVKAEMN